MNSIFFCPSFCWDQWIIYIHGKIDIWMRISIHVPAWEIDTLTPLTVFKCDTCLVQCSLPYKMHGSWGAAMPHAINLALERFPATELIFMLCGQHEYPWPSLSTSPYHSSPLAGLQGYIPYHHICCMYVRAGRLAFDWPYAGVHRSTSLTSSSLLLQQCLVRLAWIVFVIGGRWPFSWCLEGCCCQDLFNIALDQPAWIPDLIFLTSNQAERHSHFYVRSCMNWLLCGCWKNAWLR